MKIQIFCYLSLAWVGFFSGIGCSDGHEPGEDPCKDKQCGVFDGVDCGTCSGETEICNTEGQCVDVCLERQCGEVGGVDCGTCSGETEICDTDGQCVDVCAQRECGEPVEGIVCGQCTGGKLCGLTGRCFIPGNCPDGMVEIGDYGVCIDAYEVTVEQFAGFLNAHGNDCKVEGYWDMRGLYACFAEGYGSGEQIEKQGDTWSFEQGMENYPVYGVTYFGAKQACEQWGKSLCTLEAWELACGGPDDLLYPYGNTFEMDVCNSETLDCDFPSVKEIGSYPQCEGGYPGIFDMSGNVGEWVDFCWYSEYSHHYVCATPGGTGCGPKEHATCRYPDEPSDPQLEAVYDFNEKLGFRCCLYLD